MSNTTKDNLSELIRSLSKAEKRYFNLFASRHVIGEKNNYLQLFREIDKEKEHKGKPLTARERKTNKLRLRRQYLYKLILKSMRAYRSEMSVEMRLRGWLDDIAFLFEKKLYSQCEKMVSFTKVYAVKYEKQLYAMECMRWEIMLMRVQFYIGKTEEAMERCYKDMFQVIKQYENVFQYSLVAERMYFKTVKKGEARDKKEGLEFKSIMKKMIEGKFPAPLSFLASHISYFCHLKYFISCNDYARASEYAQKDVAWLEKHPHQIEDNLSSYIIALRNLIECYLITGKYDEAEAEIHKLESTSSHSDAVKQGICLWNNNMSISLYICRGEFDKAMALIKEMNAAADYPAFLEQNKKMELILYYKYSIVCFGNKEYSNAIRWLNNILNTTTVDVRSDLHCFARLLFLISHYEKGNEEFIEYKVTPIQRYLYKREQMYGMEKLLLHFFKKRLPHLYSQQDKINAFKELKMQAEKILQNPFERKVLEYFDFASWIESKAEGKTFGEVVRGKLVES